MWYEWVAEFCKGMDMQVDADDVINNLVAEIAAKVKDVAILRAQIAQMMREREDEGEITRLPVELRPQN